VVTELLVGLCLVVDDVTELITVDLRCISSDVNCDVYGEAVVGFSGKFKENLKIHIEPMYKFTVQVKSVYYCTIFPRYNFSFTSSH
jgi:hypothetical protein